MDEKHQKDLLTCIEYLEESCRPIILENDQTVGYTKRRLSAEAKRYKALQRDNKIESCIRENKDFLKRYVGIPAYNRELAKAFQDIKANHGTEISKDAKGLLMDHRYYTRQQTN